MSASQRLIPVLLSLPLWACGGAMDPPALSNSPATPPLAAAKVPLTELTTQTYLGFSGGLYANGDNQVPADHDREGMRRASAVTPLDPNGNPSASGEIVLISVGMSNTTQEWCNAGGAPPCTPQSFMAKAAANPQVNHMTVFILDGAKGGQAAPAWTSPASANYDRVRDEVLALNGVTEKQVQAVWLKEADAGPTISLPSPSADAFTLENELGNIARAMKARWPSLQQVFLSSRIYAGFATTSLNPEPFAYESGFSVQWLIQAQITQMRNGGTMADQVAGDLNFTTVAPWIVWGPYLWANGLTPRADGLFWGPVDFQSDGTHPSSSGVDKVSNLLMQFFLTSPYTGWFRTP